MTRTPLHSVLDHLRRLHRLTDAAQDNDRQLLHAFVRHNDADAFAAVVARHAPLVWGVCRRILRHHHDAEDAFQATFLILARRAASTRWRASVGGWLHTVAQRVAVRARKKAEQRRTLEQQASRTPPVDGSLRELAAVVDDELRRLPAKYREPLLLHYLEGATAEAAARQLGLSRGTFYNRLAYGRELLRQRLSRQGLSLAAPLVAAALAPEADAASRSLIEATLRGVAGNVPARVATLTTEALGFTAMVKLKIGLGLALLLGVAAGGMAMLAPLSPLPQAERPAAPSKADDNAAGRVDRYGDPLPPGAVARLGSLRFHIPAEIKTLAFAADGKSLAVSSYAGLYVIDAASGQRKQRLPVLGRMWTPEDHLAFSPDGMRLLTYGPKVGIRGKGVMHVWDVTSDRPPREYDLQGAEFVTWLGWSVQGEPLAIRAAHQAVYLHELASGKARRFAYKEPADAGAEQSRVSIFAFTPAGQALALADNNNAIHVWDTATGRKRCQFQPKNALLRRLAFSPDGRTLASLNIDLPLRQRKYVEIRDAVMGKLLHSVAAEQKDLTTMAFAPDGKTLATASRNGLRFWDVARGRERSRSQGQGPNTECIAFSGDGRTLAAVERNTGSFQLWDVASGRKKSQPIGHRAAPYGSVFSPDGRRVVSCRSLDGTTYIWDTETGELQNSIHRYPQWVRDAVFSPDGRSLFSTWTDDNVWICDAASGERREVLKLDDPDRPDTKQSAWGMHLSSDGKTLIVFSYYYPKKNAGRRIEETLITSWDTSTHKLRFRRRHPGQDSYMALSADGRMLATRYPPIDVRSLRQAVVRGQPIEQTLRLEDTATGEPLRTLPIRSDPPFPAAFSPDSRMLVTNQWNRKAGATTAAVQLWETVTAAVVLTLPGTVHSKVAFSPDGRLLALTAPEQIILVWDLWRGRIRHRFRGFDAEVTHLTFSPNGRRLVSGLDDSTLLVWDVGASASASGDKLEADAAAKAWADLATSDAPRAFRARGKLASAPAEAIPLLRKNLHPAKEADPQRLRRLLAELESEQFAVREKAQEELEKLGDLAEAALRQTLINKPTLEVRRRVQAVLERLRGPVTRPELLQALRAVAVLEDIGIAEARRLLEQLAKGSAEARLTREAKASLQRLGKEIYPPAGSGT